jgi:hypothetical protein
VHASVYRFASSDDRAGGGPGGAPPHGLLPGERDELPYKVEVWNDAKASVEQTLAVTASPSIGYAAYYAATREFPNRYITLRHKSSVISRGTARLIEARWARAGLVARRSMIGSESEGGARVVPIEGALAGREELPYLVELWTMRRDQVERVVARAASAALGRAIFLAARNEYLGRYVVLRRGRKVIEASA